MTDIEARARELAFELCRHHQWAPYGQCGGCGGRFVDCLAEQLTVALRAVDALDRPEQKPISQDDAIAQALADPRPMRGEVDRPEQKPGEQHDWSGDVINDARVCMRCGAKWDQGPPPAECRQEQGTESSDDGGRVDCSDCSASCTSRAGAIWSEWRWFNTLERGGFWRCKPCWLREKRKLTGTGIGTGKATPPPAPEQLYPCDNCGTLRTEAQGGTTFTVCDACWDKLHPKAPPPSPASSAETATREGAEVQNRLTNSAQPPGEVALESAITYRDKSEAIADAILLAVKAQEVEAYERAARVCDAAAAERAKAAFRLAASEPFAARYCAENCAAAIRALAKGGG